MSTIRKIRRAESLTDQTTARLESLIVDNHIRPGERFPAEREISKQLGVSRTVVREAVRSLVAKGLLEVKPGSGTRVKEPPLDSVIQSMSLYLRRGKNTLDFQDAIEVRRLLEVEIAGLAAERRTEEDLGHLKDNLEQTLSIKDTDKKRFIELDVEFHYLLAVATKNTLIPLLLNSVAGTMIKVRELGYEVSHPRFDPYRLHSAVFEQVQDQNISGAREAMSDHLIEAEQSMLEALALRATHESKKI